MADTGDSSNGAAPAMKKAQMTDEERIKLADKLDKELDSWMESLEKKAYTDGWSEDKWEEEMEKHPFFMTKFPEDVTGNPLLHGIQQLKYDELENTPLELAQSYKEDGNFNFKHKKYRMAVLSYTEGIRKMCGDVETEASLYNNRAAAQYFLKNYRSSLFDCKKCLKIKPDHDKAQTRAINCCLQLKLSKEAILLCDGYLIRHPDCSEIERLRLSAVNLEKIMQRDQRKEKLAEQKQIYAVAALHQAISSRGVKIEVKGDPEEVLSGMHEKPKLLEDGSLTWPVFLLYPEYSTSDFIQEFNENDTLLTMLENVFSEVPDWDDEGKYTADNLHVYYEGEDRSQLYPVDISSKLGKIVTSKGFVARDWRPAFLVFANGSIAERNCIANYSVAR